MTVLAPAGWWRGLGGLTRSGSSLQAVAWAFYDFANTIFSFAMSLWTIRFLGEGAGTFWFTAAVGMAILRGVPEGEPENEEAAVEALNG